MTFTEAMSDAEVILAISQRDYLDTLVDQLETQNVSVEEIKKAKDAFYDAAGGREDWELDEAEYWEMVLEEGLLDEDDNEDGD